MSTPIQPEERVTDLDIMIETAGPDVNTLPWEEERRELLESLDREQTMREEWEAREEAIQEAYAEEQEQLRLSEIELFGCVMEAAP